ncbi:MAG: tRNA uridine-5-carboxymethylaminomethyl(34) synthesis GTPase MnmE [Bacilli bacterium]
MTDTIAAIATSLGVGAISIVKVSGPEAINKVNKIFKGKNLNKVESHTINYGHIIHKKEVIDEVLVSVMKAPKTYTGEDVVEINCHGGISVTKKILEIVLGEGVRLAEPGEFTKRAFLNGKKDLIEAEAIMDMINANNEEARKIAMNQLDGKTSRMIKSLRQELLELLASIEVNIDYPEYYDIEEMNNQKLKENIKNLDKKLKNILKESENGKLIKDGIQTIIIGRPNVGKSSLLNKLLKEEKAIVTDIEGTTRDTVEGTINIDGITLNIIDTAGIRNTDDIIERIGVEKSLNLIDQADLIIMMLNNNETLTEEDKKLLNMIKEKKSIIVINKNDLENKLKLDKDKYNNIISVNTIEDNGINPLISKIKELFNLDEIKSKDYTCLTNMRQISLIKETLELSENIKQALEKNLPIDLIEIDIKEIWNKLGEITGDYYDEELINQLFSQFCLGK